MVRWVKGDSGGRRSGDGSVFFFKQETAEEVLPSVGGWEMCKRKRVGGVAGGCHWKGWGEGGGGGRAR